MQTKESISKLLGECELMYNGTPLLPRVMSKGDGFLIQVRGHLPNNNKGNVIGQLELQSGGKYYISSYAIDDEVVSTVWKAFQDFVIHEARECFLFKGERIFSPHFPIQKLHALCRITNEVKRS